jgi:nucleotide-binding universal stress UspA family protein
LVERILVVVGDDEASMAAVQVAGELAARFGAEVLAVRVEVVDVPCRGPSPEACGLGDLGAALAPAMSQLRQRGVNCRGERWRTQRHQIVDALLKAADEYEADLLVIRSRRRSGLRDAISRDLGLRVARCAARPVLLVR